MVAMNYNVQNAMKDANQVLDKVGNRGAMLAVQKLYGENAPIVAQHVGNLLKVGYGDSSIATLFADTVRTYTDRNGKTFVDFNQFYKAADNIVQTANKMQENYDAKQASESINAKLTNDSEGKTVKIPTARNGMRYAGIAAGIGGLVLSAAASGGLSFTSDTHASGKDDYGNFVYVLHIHNASTGTSEDDSGIKVTAYTGNAIADSFGFSGGSIGDYWALNSADMTNFIASITDGLGPIDPTARDPSADDLYITFSSPYGQLQNNQKIDVLSDRNGTYSITDAQLPGVPEPATLALMLGGFLAVAATRKR